MNIMNRQYKKLLGRLTFGVMLALGTAFASGCAKDAKEDIAVPGEGTRVVINVGGIDNGKPLVANKLRASAGSASSEPDSKAKLIEGSAFDVLVTQSGSVESSSRGLQSRSSASTSSGLKAATPMPNGSAYRLFLRKQGDATLVSAALTSGTPGAISVEKGASYEWFALSYNSTTEVPDATDNVVALSDLTNLLYAKGEFTVPSGDGDVIVPLDVVFRPRVTRAVIEINTRGMFAPVADATVTVTGLYAAPEAIDVVTGNLIGGEKNQTIAFEDFAPVAGTGGQRMQATAFIGGNANENITVSVTNLRITLDDGNIRNFGEASLNQTFAPEAGMEQSIVLNFLESPLTRSNVGWARSNLYYTAGYNPYRFFHTNPRTDNPNSYFSFKGHLPRTLASANAANQKDPCALVYPAGRWKTPTSAELATLTSTQGLLSNVVGGLLATLGLGATPGVGFETGEYIEMTPTYSAAPTTGQNPAYGDNNSATNRLRFNYNGFMQNVDVVELIELELGSTYGSQAAFWTSQTINDANLGGLLGGVVDAGGWSFVGRDVALLGLIGRRGYAIQSAGITNIDLLGAVNVLSSSLMNVRCTRNTAWNPDAPGYNPEPTL